MSFLLRLPTTTIEGRFFLGGVVALGFLATATDRNFVLLVLGVLLAVVVISVFFSAQNLRGITFSRSLPETVMAGEAFQVRIRLENHRRWLPARGVTLKDALQAGRSGLESRCFAPTIPAGGHVTFVYTARIRRRGAYNVTNALLSTRYPMGLFLKRCMVEHPSRLVVYPRMEEIAGENLPRSRNRHQGVRQRVFHHERGDEFRGLKDYRPGDDPRRIAWRVSARQGCLVLKELERQIQGKVVVVLATSLEGVPRRDRKSALESAVTLTASLVRHLHREGRPFFFAAPGFFAEVFQRSARLHACLEFLAMVRSDSRGDARRVVEAAGSRLLAGCDVIVVGTGNTRSVLPTVPGCRFHQVNALASGLLALQPKGVV